MKSILLLVNATFIASTLLCALTSFAETTKQPVEGGQCLVYIGTYTGAKSKGIYVCRLDQKTGALSAPELAVETPSPSFLAIHPNRRFLIAVGEIGSFAGKPSGVVTSFSIDPKTGSLTMLNQQPSGGGGPCHLAVDKTGKCVVVANYGGGSVEALPIQADGRLGEPSAFIQHQGAGANQQRQEAPHAHWVGFDAANRFAFCADLGLDKVLVYRFDAARGTLVANDPPAATLKAGAGPRHIAFHPTGRYAYVINEMDCTVTALGYDDRRGAFTQLQSVTTLPEAVKSGDSTAEIAVHPNGKFLYGSNRGHDSIVVFAIDQKTGKLTLVEHQPTQGKTPRNFAIDPTGNFLLAANQGSDNVVVFRVDPPTGRLTPTGFSVEVGMPVCVTFLPVK